MEDRQSNVQSPDDNKSVSRTDLYDWIFPNYSRTTKRYILDAFCGVFGVLAVIGLLNTEYWILSLPANFLVQYLFVLAGVSIGYLLLSAYYRLLIPICILPFLIATISPLYLSGTTGSPGAHTRSGETLTVMSINVHTGNKRTEAVRNLIKTKQPDLVLLMEINQRWLRKLEPLFDDYPHRTAQPRSDNFGIALFSRRPFEKISIRRIGSYRVPVVFASFRHEERTVRMVGIHTLPPVTPHYFHGRNQLISAVGSMMAIQNGPRFVIGDLNMTSWSSHFRTFMKTAGLRDSRKGFGIQPTWPAFRFHPFLICLDHCLVSKEFVVRNRTTGPNVGSDHYPIIVDLALRDTADMKTP